LRHFNAVYIRKRTNYLVPTIYVIFERQIGAIRMATCHVSGNSSSYHDLDQFTWFWYHILGWRTSIVFRGPSTKSTVTVGKLITIS